VGGNYHYRALILAEKHEHVYLDTAFLPFFCRRLLPPISPEALIAHAARIAGAEKVLYGSEGLWPQAVLGADLTEHEKALILGENALRLLGIQRPSG
jgi:predicted TIM-barrel fold metal-dependent hydrolase